MAAGQQIDSLITALEQSVESGLAYFQGPGSQSKVMIGRWEAREVLCHLVWWHQATAEGIESVASGGAPYRIYASVDEMNARAVGRLAGTDMLQLMEMARQSQARLVRAARACSRRPIVVYRLPRPRWQWAASGRMPSSSARARACW